MFTKKDKELDSIKAELDGLMSNLEFTTSHKNKNEFQLSDAKRKLSLFKQNIKYLRQKKIISVKNEYERALMDVKRAEKDIELLEYRGKKLEEALVRIEVNLAKQKQLYEAVLDANRPKVLEFKQRK